MGKVLVTGASGYIGGRLVPELLARGYAIRVMVRSASPEQQRLWPGAEIAVADALEMAGLRKAFDGIEVAFYLIHSLQLGPKKFAAADIQAAVNFRKAAEEFNVKRIIYLGGLGDTGSPLSKHLQSRLEVAEELKRGKVPVTILRAAVVIGSGSASYEIVEHLAKNLPVLLIPKWTGNRCQPIGIRDVIKYLVGVLETPKVAGKRFDIGGRDTNTYQEMIEIMAELHGRKKVFIPFPFSSISFFAYVASLFTPVPASITRCLFDGLQNEVICKCNEIKTFLPFELLSYREAIVRAMTREEQDKVHTRWSDAYLQAHELAMRLHEVDGPISYSAYYSLVTDKKACSLFQSICRIGGKDGWFHNNWMWRLRGLVDRILLGVGSSRGRRSLSTLKTHDVIGFWRVEDLKPDHSLLLRAEMKLPGRAWLEFTIDRDGSRNRLAVKAYFDTGSLFGKSYWYIFKPFHNLIFRDLIKQIERRSEASAEA
jgi:uncharacterized protein YbjT (DUF2867 family)